AGGAPGRYVTAAAPLHQPVRGYKKEVLGLTYRAEMRLLQQAWPGNVRELENVIGHAAMMTTRNTIDVADLPLYLSAPSPDHELLPIPSEDGGADAARTPCIL